MKLEHDVISSITDIKKLKVAVRTVSPFILLNNCNIANLGNLVNYGHKHNHRIFVNVENIVGLYITSDSLRLLKKVYGVDGIYTTSKHTARRASKVGIPTVLRVFLIDTTSLSKSLSPDIRDLNLLGLDLMPSHYAVRYIDRFKDITGLNSNFVTGGFIDCPEAMERAFDSGFNAICTSDQKLWKYLS